MPCVTSIDIPDPYTCTERMICSENRSLLAHELAYVEPYDELGVGECARRNAADPKPIAEEAQQKSRRVMRSL